MIRLRTKCRFGQWSSSRKRKWQQQGRWWRFSVLTMVNRRDKTVAVIFQLGILKWKIWYTIIGFAFSTAKAALQYPCSPEGFSQTFFPDGEGVVATSQDCWYLRGYCTSYQKLACFVLYLKIINNFLKNKVCILSKMVQGTQNWHWNFSRPSGF